MHHHRWNPEYIFEEEYRYNPRECSKCGETGHDKRKCPRKTPIERKKTLLYIPIPHHLGKHFPSRKYPPHITLLHIGDLTRKQGAKVEKLIDNVIDTIRPFEVSMVDFSVFVTKNYLFPHMAVSSTALTSIHHKLKDYLRSAGLTVRHYGDYTPHATLEKMELDEVYVGPKPAGAWIANEIVLTGFNTYTYELGETSIDKQVIIMRGIPGSGKSTYLADNYPEAKIVSADEFFVRRGVYSFDPAKAWLAHKICYDNYINLIDADIELVAVDNTNITKSDVRRYRDAAIQRGYAVKVITVLEDPEIAFESGVHNVSEDKILEMHKKLNRTEIPDEWDHLIIDYT
jgi:2'-5' RNA ligase/predicted kinase